MKRRPGVRWSGANRSGGLSAIRTMRTHEAHLRKRGESGSLAGNSVEGGEVNRANTARVPRREIALGSAAAPIQVAGFMLPRTVGQSSDTVG
jgi:hypothetical protein